MKPVFFATPAEFRAWLQRHHSTAEELIVGFYRKDSGKPSITWSEAVDEALCFGWIDGIRSKHSAIAYSNRFTPRRPQSNWSDINIAKVAQLTSEGRMQPAGMAAYAKRTEAKSRVYTYELEGMPEFPPAFAKKFKANKKAWAFFQGQPPFYRKLSTRWVIGAKQEATRLRRLDSLIVISESGRRR